MWIRTQKVQMRFLLTDRLILRIMWWMRDTRTVLWYLALTRSGRLLICKTYSGIVLSRFQGIGRRVRSHQQFKTLVSILAEV